MRIHAASSGSLVVRFINERLHVYRIESGISAADTALTIDMPLREDVGSAAGQTPPECLDIDITQTNGVYLVGVLFTTQLIYAQVDADPSPPVCVNISRVSHHRAKVIARGTIDFFQSSASISTGHSPHRDTCAVIMMDEQPFLFTAETSSASLASSSSPVGTSAPLIPLSELCDSGKTMYALRLHLTAGHIDKVITIHSSTCIGVAVLKFTSKWLPSTCSHSSCRIYLTFEFLWQILAQSCLL
jgi:hypothetical protein